METNQQTEQERNTAKTAKTIAENVTPTAHDALQATITPGGLVPLSPQHVDGMDAPPDATINLNQVTASLNDTLKSQRCKNYDPSKPLDPPRYEKFIIQVFRGVQKYQAYQAAISPGVDKKRAGIGASHILKVPKAAERLKYLLEKEAAAKIERPMDRQEMRAKMETIARFGAPNEIMSAIKLLTDFATQDAARQEANTCADPAMISSHLNNYIRAEPDMDDDTQAGYVRAVLQALPGIRLGVWRKVLDALDVKPLPTPAEFADVVWQHIRAGGPDTPEGYIRKIKALLPTISDDMWLAVLTANRADAPLNHQTPINIDYNQVDTDPPLATSSAQSTSV